MSRAACTIAAPQAGCVLRWPETGPGATCDAGDVVGEEGCSGIWWALRWMELGWCHFLLRLPSSALLAIPPHLHDQPLAVRAAGQQLERTSQETH